MLLYHGTAAANVPAILANGLKPRGKGKGNWKHTVDSCPTAVYLTDAYALYYATTGTKPGDRLAVLEIDTTNLDVWAFAPDEDWLEQVTRKDATLAPIDKPMGYRTRWYRRRLLNFAQFWPDSLKGLGNVTYHSVIPAKAITRVAYVDAKTNLDLIMVAGIDPMIHVSNYRICGPKYRNSMRQLFGEFVELENDDLERILPDPAMEAERVAYLAETWARVQVKAVQAGL